MQRRDVLLLAFLAAATWKSGTESCQQDARMPEGKEGLESLVRQLNHSAPSPLQLWTTLATELLTAAGCESRVSGQHCDKRQLCEQLSQHAVASNHRLRRAPEGMEFVTTGFDPITQVDPGASTPKTNREETDQQGRVLGTGPAANGQQKYDDVDKWAPVRALSSATLWDGARRKRSPFEGESPDYLYVYADDIPRDLVPRDYDDVAEPGGGSGLSPRFPFFPRHNQQGGHPQLPPHPQTSWWLQQDMMSNWPNGPAAAPGPQETQARNEGRRFHDQRHGFVGHLDQMSPHAHPHSGSDAKSDAATESRSVMKQQQPVHLENIRRRTDNRYNNKLVPRDHNRGRPESEHSERTLELTHDGSVVTASVLTVTEASLRMNGMVLKSSSSPSPLGTTAVRTTRASELFRNNRHDEEHSNSHSRDSDNRPNHPANVSKTADHVAPGTPFEHDVTSGQWVMETAARILFAMLHAEESSCGRLFSAGLDPQRWVDSVCRPMSRRDKRSELGGRDDDDNDNTVRSVNTNLEDSVQRAIQSLEAKMVATLARWNPAHILGRVWTGLSDEAFLQHQQCFHIQREVASAKDAMRPVSAGVCHLELWNFLKSLTGTVVYKLLRGQRPITDDVPCQMDFVSDIFNKYGTRDRPAGCTMTQSISLQGIENILTDARSSSSDNNMTTTQSSADASLVSGMSRAVLGPSTVSKNFSAREIVGFVFPAHTGVFSVQQFYQMCPVLLQQVTMVRQSSQMTVKSNVKSNDAAVDHPDLKKVTVVTATGIQSYGLGTASVAVITLCSFVGAVLVRMCRGLGHHYAMAAMLALAFGNLCGDAVLHLLPKALEPHDSAESSVRRSYTLPGNVRVDVSVVKGFCLLFSVYVFWLLELFTSRYYRHQRPTKKDVCPETTVKSRHQDIDPRHRIPMSDMREEMEMTMQTNQMTTQQTSSYEIISARPVYPSKTIVMEVEENVVTSVHLVWMIVVGDVIHNLADGLAIGAAFSHSLPLGLCTSLAVVCHELPHELGDFAILLSTGMPMKRALLLNVLTGLAAFLGLYTGVALGSDHLQRQWVLMSVAGMFLYVSLADLVPELVQYFRLFQNVRMFLVQNLGLLSGFALMFGLVLLEDKMRFLPEKITAHT